MSLLDLIRGKRTLEVATTIRAIPATDHKEIAKIAKVAVAPAKERNRLVRCEANELVQPVCQVQRATTLIASRVTLFVTRGVPVTVAERLIYRLAQRDHELDDRRSCAECGMYDHGCTRGLEPLGGGGVMVLHRCKGFTDDNF